MWFKQKMAVVIIIHVNEFEVQITKKGNRQYERLIVHHTTKTTATGYHNDDKDVSVPP
jgi:hypothetical protein